jgi:hypothetical protein
MNQRDPKIGIACLIESYGHKNLHRKIFHEFGANAFFSDEPRLANSYRIHSYGKYSDESNASERKKIIGS